MSLFGALAMWIYVSWDNFLIPMSQSWSLTFWASNGGIFFHSLNILRYVSLRWDAVYLLLEKWSIGLSIEVIFWWSFISLWWWWKQCCWFEIAHSIECRYTGVWYMRIWLIIWYIICWRQCKMKIVRSVMTLVLSAGSNMKWGTTLTLCMITF